MFFVAFVSAQTQQGHVKTIGRPNKPGTHLGNVTIRMRGMLNAVVSSANGDFSVSIPGKKDGDAIYLLSVGIVCSVGDCNKRILPFEI